MCMIMGRYIFVFGEEDYVLMWDKVVGCMGFFIFYFDIMGVCLMLVV